MSVTALLLKDGEVYAPKPLGTRDILVVQDRIVAIGTGLQLPPWAEAHVLPCHGRLIFPGLVDGHVHIAGGGGEGGPQYRTPELQLTDLTRYGITTVVGLLGTDGTTRSVPELLAKARGLLHEGLNVWIYTGAYQVPTRTVTGSPRSDIVLVDRVIGVGEIAIADQRGSHPSARELAQLAGEARVGGLLAGKAGIVHLHVGDGPQRLQVLFDVIRLADVPIRTLVPTHVNRHRALLDDAARFLDCGGVVDLTASIVPTEHDPAAVDPVQAAEVLRGNPSRWPRMTLSTDAGGSAPVFDDQGRLIKVGVGRPDSLFRTVVAWHEQLGLGWEEALGPVTAHPARVLKLADVGSIQVGARADLVVSDGQTVLTVIAGGRMMVVDGRPVVKGTFESEANAP